MAARSSIVRTFSRQFSCAARRTTGFACQAQSQVWRAQAISRGPTQGRYFSASRMLKEKQYTQDHEWIEMSPDGKTCTLGISTYAAKALGDVVYIELPSADLEISAGDAIGAVESVKSASDILTPVGGRVVEVNGLLEAKPAEINRDPEGEAWIARIEVKGEVEGETMSSEEYREFTEDE